MTNRQFLAWKTWCQDEWNEPGRSDHYLMQLTRAIDTLIQLKASGKSIGKKLSDFKIPFEFKPAEELPQKTVEEQAAEAVAIAKAIWRARLKDVPTRERTAAE